MNKTKSLYFSLAFLATGVIAAMIGIYWPDGVYPILQFGLLTALLLVDIVLIIALIRMWRKEK